MAQKIDPTKPNAYKNIGIALAGQGHYRGAAEAFIAATRANAADPRSLRHLEELLKEHPELQYDFSEASKACENAVAAVAQRKELLKPVVYRGWRKQWFILKSKLRKLVN